MTRLGRVDASERTEVSPTLDQVKAISPQLRNHLQHEETLRCGGLAAGARAHLKALYLDLFIFVAENLAHVCREETDATSALLASIRRDLQTKAASTPDAPSASHAATRSDNPPDG